MTKERKTFYLFKKTTKKITQIVNKFRSDAKDANLSIVVSEAIDLLHTELFGKDK